MWGRLRDRTSSARPTTSRWKSRSTARGRCGSNRTGARRQALWGDIFKMVRPVITVRRLLVAALAARQIMQWAITPLLGQATEARLPITARWWAGLTTLRPASFLLSAVENGIRI